MIFPASNRARDLWIDVRVTHALQRDKLRQTYKFCREVFKVMVMASDDRALSSYLHKPTPSVLSSVKEKTEAYKGMLKIASDQGDAVLRNHVPRVMSYVISHEGEFSEPLIGSRPLRHSPPIGCTIFSPMINTIKLVSSLTRRLSCFVVT